MSDSELQSFERVQVQSAHEVLEHLLALACEGDIPDIQIGGFGGWVEIPQHEERNPDGYIRITINPEGQDRGFSCLGASHIVLITYDTAGKTQDKTKIPAGVFSTLPWSFANRLRRAFYNAYCRSPERVPELSSALAKGLSSLSTWTERMKSCQRRLQEEATQKGLG